PHIYFNKDVYTYAQVEDEANKGARVLKNLGIKKGDRVAIIMENCPQYIIALFMIFKTGAVAVPVNNMLTDSEIAYILNDCEAKLLFTSEKYSKMAEYLRNNVETIENILSWGNISCETIDIRSACQRMSGSPLEYNFGTDDLVFFVYTSGTTGHPKGAMLTHGNLLSDAKSIDDYFHWDPKDKFLLFLPIFHSYTLMTSVFYSTYLGCSIVMLESVMELKTKKFRDILLFKRPRIMLGVPQVYQALIKASMPKWFIKFFYPIKLHISGGAPLAEETLIAFKEKFGRPILEGYGLSEASPVVAFNTLERQKVGTVGKPLPGIEAKVVDSEDRELPIGEVGELIIKGGNVMKGYWRMPKATDDAIKNGWLFTGDFARIDEDNYITIVDRKKDLIITKGMNVYPREVEDVIKQIPGVEAVAVIGVPLAGKDEKILAYVKVSDNANVTVKTIKNHLKSYIASYKCPKNIYIVDDLPLTATGKVLKRLLKEQVLKGEFKID
ncbi:MAG: long-chain-fatty-acid--CoA ligase, partial [Deferribacterales bacterium]|nr:long-chain-fatty-acid--CoA ligase [Deferribacterales bacterium]